MVVHYVRRNRSIVFRSNKSNKMNVAPLYQRLNKSPPNPSQHHLSPQICNPSPLSHSPLLSSQSPSPVQNATNINKIQQSATNPFSGTNGFMPSVLAPGADLSGFGVAYMRHQPGCRCCKCNGRGCKSWILD